MPMSQARDPKTFYASKLDAIQDEITKKEAESREISAKLRDVKFSLGFEKSYLSSTDMEKLYHVMEELEEDKAYNSNEICWLMDTQKILLDRYQGKWRDIATNLPYICSFFPVSNAISITGGRFPARNNVLHSMRTMLL